MFSRAIVIVREELQRMRERYDFRFGVCAIEIVQFKFSSLRGFPGRRWVGTGGCKCTVWCEDESYTLSCVVFAFILYCASKHFATGVFAAPVLVPSPLRWVGKQVNAVVPFQSCSLALNALEASETTEEMLQSFQSARMSRAQLKTSEGW